MIGPLAAALVLPVATLILINRKIAPTAPGPDSRSVQFKT